MSSRVVVLPDRTEASPLSRLGVMVPESLVSPVRQDDVLHPGNVLEVAEPVRLSRSQDGPLRGVYLLSRLWVAEARATEHRNLLEVDARHEAGKHLYGLYPGSNAVAKAEPEPGSSDSGGAEGGGAQPTAVEI